MNQTTGCDRDEDCSVYLMCNGDGMCGCLHAQGAVPDEGGVCRASSTREATAHFVLTCLGFTGSVLVLAYHSYATYLVARLRVKGNLLKFAVFVEVAALSYAALCAVRVVSLSDPSLFGVGAMHTSETIAGVLWSAHNHARTHRTRTSLAIVTVAARGGSHSLHLCFGGGSLPRPRAGRVLDGEHARGFCLKATGACPDGHQHLDDLVHCAIHLAAHHETGRVQGTGPGPLGHRTVRDMGCAQRPHPDLCRSPRSVRIAQDRRGLPAHVVEYSNDAAHRKQKSPTQQDISVDRR